jgi:hypothetical protein
MRSAKNSSESTSVGNILAVNLSMARFAKAPNAASSILQTLNQVGTERSKVCNVDDLGLFVRPRLRNRASAQDGDFGDFRVVERYVERGRAYQAGGTSDDNMHLRKLKDCPLEIAYSACSGLHHGGCLSGRQANPAVGDKAFCCPVSGLGPGIK